MPAHFLLLLAAALADGRAAALPPTATLCPSDAYPAASEIFSFDGGVDPNDPAGGTFAPLCNGVSVVADLATRRLVLLSAAGAELKSVRLPAAADAIAAAPDDGAVYATLPSTKQLARWELATGKLSTVSLPLTPIALAPAGKARVFVLLHAPSFAKSIALVDGRRRTVVATFPLDGGYFAQLLFEPVHRSLFAGGRAGGLSPIRRFEFDGALKLTPREEYRTCESLQQMAVSRDGARFAAACGGGDSDQLDAGYAPYLISDRSATDLNAVSGSFNVGPFPRGAAFTADGAKLLVSDSTSLKAFDVATHAPSFALDPSDAGVSFVGPLCGGATGRRAVGLSQGGSVAFVVAPCGPGRSSLYPLRVRR